MNTNDEIQLQILDQLQSQTDLYRRALPLVQNLARSYEIDHSTQSELDRLNEILKQATVHDEQMLQLRKQLGTRPVNRSVKHASAELANLIQTVMHAFDEIESKAVAAKQRLTPKLSQQMQAKKMHSAYTDPVHTRGH